MLSLNVIQFVLTELSLVSLSLVSWTSNHSIDLFLSLPFAYTPRIPSKTALGQSSRLIGFFTAFILCEYFIHLPREVEFFWKRKITGASVLFLSNRYISLAVQVFQNTAIGVTSEKVRLSPPVVTYSKANLSLHRGMELTVSFVPRH